MAEGCCSGIAKIMLFIVNFCVWVVGIALIAVGSWVLIDTEKYSSLFGSENTLTIVAGIIIGIGCFIFLVGFSACCGAIKEVTFLLKLYFALVLVVVIVEVVAAILAFVFQDDLKKAIETTVTETIKDTYGEDDQDVATNSIDALQKDFKCCGGNNISDWAGSKWGLKPINQAYAAPKSCCSTKTDTCNAGTGPPGNPEPGSKMNTGGCVDAFGEWLQSNYLIIGGVCLGLLVFEILAMVFACCLINGIQKANNYE